MPTCVNCRAIGLVWPPQLAVMAAADFVELCWRSDGQIVCEPNLWSGHHTLCQLEIDHPLKCLPLQGPWLNLSGIFTAGPWGPRGSPRRATKLPALQVFLEHDHFPQNCSCREFHSGFGGFAEGSVLAPRCLPSVGLYVLPFYRLFLRTGTANVQVQCPLFH